MTVFPSSDRSKSSKKASHDLLYCRKKGTRSALARSVCCKDISTCFDWKGFSETLQALERGGIFAKPARLVQSIAHGDQVLTAIQLCLQQASTDQYRLQYYSEALTNTILGKTFPKVTLREHGDLVSRSQFVTNKYFCDDFLYSLIGK